MDLKHRADLYKLLPPNPICAELGCAEGYFSADILRWPAGKLYMVDLWDTIPNQKGDGGNDKGWHDRNFQAAMDRVNFAIERVHVLRGISWEMAKFVEDESLDFIHIDACHSYECVKRDLSAWFPKVKEGGIISGHDYLMPQYGVFQAVKEFTDGKFKVHTLVENKQEDAGFYFVNK